MTKQRRLILAIVNGYCGHPTAEEVFIEARKDMPGIAMATIYNNLNHLVKEGKIRRVPIHGSADCYDRVGFAHEHMICEQCGKIKDVVVRDFVGEVEQKSGEKVTGYELNIRFVCGECRKKRERHAMNSC